MQHSGTVPPGAVRGSGPEGVAKDEAGRRTPKGLDYKSLPSYRMTLASTPLLTSKSQAEHCDVHIHDIS